MSLLPQVFEGCVREGGEALVQEWVLMSLGNFSRREPASLAVWFLTCFLVAASRCISLRSAFPSVLCWPTLLACHSFYQPADLSPDQLELFCLAALQFASALPSKHHKHKFRTVFSDVATPGSPFAAMLQFLDSQSNLQLEWDLVLLHLLVSFVPRELMISPVDVMSFLLCLSC